MKLWLLRPAINRGEDDPWDPWDDTIAGFVVRAETEYQARTYAQRNGLVETWNKYNLPRLIPAWTDERYSTCYELTPDGDIGVVMKDSVCA